MAAPFAIRELRYKSGTTFNKTHTAASNAAWDPGTAVKIRAHDISLDGLEYSSEMDPTMRSYLVPQYPAIPTLRMGKLAFKAFLEGANSGATASPVATLLSLIMGGVANPSARTDAVEGGSTTTTINATAHGQTDGMAVLLGVRGDAQGNGEARVVTNASANAFDLLMAITGAQDVSDALVYSTTVYLRNTTQNYIDFLCIGKSAEDQIQGVGGMGPFKLSGLAPGEVPKVEFDLTLADWQEVPSGERDALSSGTAATGNQPATDRGLGGCFIQDVGTTTRAAFKISDLSIDPGIEFAPIPDPNGVNGVGGWQLVKAEPSFEFTAILEGSTDPLIGFYDDFANGALAAGAQAKHVLFQFGHTAQRCVAIDFPRSYFTVAPVRVEVGGLVGVKCKMHATAGAHDETSAAAALANSPMRIHFF